MKDMFKEFGLPIIEASVVVVAAVVVVVGTI